MMYATRFTVAGFGEFPFDMLRYDTCFPATEADTGEMVAHMAGEQRQIELITYHSVKNAPRLTEDRWAAFGWHIIKVELGAIGGGVSR